MDKDKTITITLSYADLTPMANSLMALLGAPASALEGATTLSVSCECNNPEELLAALRGLAEQVPEGLVGSYLGSWELLRTSDKDADEPRGIFLGGGVYDEDLRSFLFEKIDTLKGDSLWRSTGFWPETYGEPDPSISAHDLDGNPVFEAAE